MTSQQQLLKEARAIIARLEAGEAASAAVATPTDGAPASEAINKGLSGDPYEAKQSRYESPLSKMFLRLARKDKQFHFLGDDRVLEDPRGFLRAKHGPEAGEYHAGRYKVSDADLEAIIGTLMAMPPEERQTVFTQENGMKMAQALDLAAKAGVFGEHSEILRRALDVSSGGPLIRTDLDPILYEAYLRDFPVLDEIRKIPANGVLHTFNQRTSPGSASTISDLGDMSGAFSNSSLSQFQSSHIATIVAPRAIGLKFQYAVQQSGMNYNVAGDENLEIVGAMLAMSKKVQTLILQGNFSTASKTLNDEEGLTDANGFDGIRSMLKGGSTSLTKATGDSYVDTINRAVGQIINAGGSARNLLVLCSLYTRFQINLELQGYLRVVNTVPGGGISTNLSANGLVTLADWMARIVNVPADAQGNGLGNYTFSGSPVEDIDVLDLSTWALAYLGSATPSILELPVGFNNQLSRVYYPFYMVGLVGFVPSFNRKIRVPNGSL